MLFLHVLLFSLVGTSVLAGGGKKAGSAAVHLNDGFSVQILGKLDGYWSWDDYVIRVSEGKVFGYSPTSQAWDEAFTSLYDYKTIAGDPLCRVKFSGSRPSVSGLL